MRDSGQSVLATGSRGIAELALVAFNLYHGTERRGVWVQQ